MLHEGPSYPPEPDLSHTRCGSGAQAKAREEQEAAAAKAKAEEVI